MKELNANDLDQVSGGMNNPFYHGYCYNCNKEEMINRTTGECYRCHSTNTDFSERVGNK